MAFGKVSKEDLIAMGLDPEKTVKKEDLDTFKTGITNDVNTNIQDSLKALETKLTASITDALAAHKPNVEGNRNTDTPPTTEIPKDVDPMTFMEDPMKHVKGEINKVGSALLMQNMAMAAENAYELLAGRLPGFQNEALKKEIDEEWAKYPIQNRANPKMLLQNLHDMVVGRHSAEIAQDTAKKEGKYNLVHSGGTRALNTTTPPAPPKAEDTLSAAELAAAKNFGLTPEEYVAQKGGMKYA